VAAEAVILFDNEAGLQLAAGSFVVKRDTLAWAANFSLRPSVACFSCLTSHARNDRLFDDFVCFAPESGRGSRCVMTANFDPGCVETFAVLVLQRVFEFG
jgi:hypothetical protein